MNGENLAIGWGAMDEGWISEVRYRKLFEAVPCGVAVFDAVEEGADFVFRDMNRSAELLDALNREMVLGRSLTEVFPGLRNSGILDVFRRVWETGKAEVLLPFAAKEGKAKGWKENFVYRLPTGEVVAVYSDLTSPGYAMQLLKGEPAVAERS